VIANSWIFLLGGFVPGLIGSISFVFLFSRRRKVAAVDDSIRNTTFVFSGNLKQTGLIDAVQFLEIGQREGILHVYCGRRKGYLIFCEGHVIDAFYRNKTGKDAIFSMLSLDEGDFYFEPKSISQPRLISESIMDIAFEWDDIKQMSMAQSQ